MVGNSVTAIPTREYCGQQVPTKCILCGGELEWERAESSSSDDVVMAEAYDPKGYEEFVKAHIAANPGRDAPLEAYDAWVKQGKAGVVHGSCMEAHGWEMS